MDTREIKKKERQVHMTHLSLTFRFDIRTILSIQRWSLDAISDKAYWIVFYLIDIQSACFTQKY